MPTPLALNDAEFAAVQAAAAPIHPLQRDAFLKALAEELERHPVVGPGLVQPPGRGRAAPLCHRARAGNRGAPYSAPGGPLRQFAEFERRRLRGNLAPARGGSAQVRRPAACFLLGPGRASLSLQIVSEVLVVP